MLIHRGATGAGMNALGPIFQTFLKRGNRSELSALANMDVQSRGEDRHMSCPIYADSRKDKRTSVCQSRRIVTVDGNADISKDDFEDLQGKPTNGCNERLDFSQDRVPDQLVPIFEVLHDVLQVGYL